jgi:hypothetical protein
MKKKPTANPQEPKGPNDRVYVVKYRMPGEEGRNPRRMTINAINQTDAMKAAKATVPGARIVGGPQELDEGVADFAKTVGRFLSRCVGRGCLGYARSSIRSNPDSLSHIRKLVTRELAKRAGEKLMKMGGADAEYLKVQRYKQSLRKKTRKKRNPARQRKG